jgi:flagellar hook protein FlgE
VLAANEKPRRFRSRPIGKFHRGRRRPYHRRFHQQHQTQKGQNLFASGINSGVPIQGNPGEQGIGSIVAGAVELSNTDIGGSLTDLILASTMYRGNARVITTTQQLFDELLALKR